MKLKPSKEIARHKWLEILPKLGVSINFLTAKHGPCPICGGKDRFRFDDKNGEGSFYCNSCGAGDGFDLAHRVTGRSFKDLASEVTMLAGNINPSPMKEPEKNEEELKRRQKRLWETSYKPVGYGAVDLYLQRRLNGNTFWSPSIREHSFPDGRIAMVAKVATPEGKAANLHLTWITRSGDKADVPVKKQLMAGSLPSGSAIRLMAPGPTLGIAEGIETALSAHLIFKIPCWGAINAQNMAKWTPPDGTREVWIFADRDENFTGQLAAFTLAQRLYKKVERVVVAIPDFPNKDWNDQFVGEGL